MKQICLKLIAESNLKNIPIVTASQVARPATEKGNISIGSLSESSDLEKSANQVISCINNSVSSKTNDTQDRPNTISLKVLKVRSQGYQGWEGEYKFNGNQNLIFDKIMRTNNRG